MDYITINRILDSTGSMISDLKFIKSELGVNENSPIEMLSDSNRLESAIENLTKVRLNLSSLLSGRSDNNAPT